MMTTTKDSKWNSLTLKQRAELMRIFIKHGIYDLQQIKDTYNNFDSTKTDTKPEYVDTYSNGGNLFFAGGENNTNGNNPPAYNLGLRLGTGFDAFGRSVYTEQDRQRDEQFRKAQETYNKQQGQKFLYRAKQREAQRNNIRQKDNTSITNTNYATDRGAVTNNPAKYWMTDLFRKGKTHTEEEFTLPQLEAIANLVKLSGNEHVQSKGYSSLQEYFTQFPNDTLQIPIRGKNYKTLNGTGKYGATDGNLSYKLTDPLGQVEHIIGQTDRPVKVYKDGFNLTDTYDFNEGSGLKYPPLYDVGNPYAWARFISTHFGQKDTDSDLKKNKFNIKVGLKDWK